VIILDKTKEVVFGQSGICHCHGDLTLGFSRPWVSSTGHQNSICRTGDWNPRGY